METIKPKIGDEVRYWDSEGHCSYWATVRAVTKSTAVVDLAWAKGKRVALKNLRYPNEEEMRKRRVSSRGLTAQKNTLDKFFFGK